MRGKAIESRADFVRQRLLAESNPTAEFEVWHGVHCGERGGHRYHREGWVWQHNTRAPWAKRTCREVYAVWLALAAHTAAIDRLRAGEEG